MAIHLCNNRRESSLSIISLRSVASAMRPSATDKKSFSIDSWPIFAWRSLTLGPWSVGRSLLNTSAAFSKSCFFQSVIWFGWTWYRSEAQQLSESFLARPTLPWLWMPVHDCFFVFCSYSDPLGEHYRAISSLIHLSGFAGPALFFFFLFLYSLIKVIRHAL